MFLIPIVIKLQISLNVRIVKERMSIKIPRVFVIQDTTKRFVLNVHVWNSFAFRSSSCCQRSIETISPYISVWIVITLRHCVCIVVRHVVSQGIKVAVVDAMVVAVQTMAVNAKHVMQCKWN